MKAELILVIDDDRDIRECLRELLTDAGYRVQTASHGQAALDLLAGGELPAVILLDLMMPVMDGMTFRDRQLADPRLAQIPLVVVTASGRLRARQMANVTVLAKPLRMKLLLDTVAASCRPRVAA